ncbi:chemotaxis protein CheW [Bosea sp. (in: a-proteobacteria)]|uniref:chemotaxis protein CheW n=1 Tax=Bosea sp. (in: a-proteobacteria) TaxID=1871050 RepID=UPI00277851CB|nr:chemotaxis protein CheW [Bosea sp. (in: a-proteobacteria)]MDP3493299.1 chemotaxis protein CheW [Hyphomonadaceae bacterium]WRH57163.1 MAG: chemotaxis protein CheW [Bosea sp. (in: a-proteobacteria)]
MDRRSDTTARQVSVQQLVLFSLGGRKFGVDVANVREIRGWQPVTELPHGSQFMLGVINLRGLVVPVFDLQAMLGFLSGDTASGVVIVIEYAGQSAGFLADGVSDIINVTPEQFNAPPPCTGCAEELLHAMIIQGDDIIGLLDLSAIVPAAQDAIAA